MKNTFLFALLFSFLVSPVSASFYAYDVVSPIVVSGVDLGYIKPYKISSILGTYAYLKYRRYGFPEGDTYPAPLVSGTTIYLPFGVGDYLKVKVNSIGSSGVDLDVDASSIIPKATTSVPGASTTTIKLPQITIPTVTLPLVTIPGMPTSNLTGFANQLNSRINKVLNKSYYSSLHLWGSKAMRIDYEVSSSIEKKEENLSESFADFIIPLLASSSGLPVLASEYCKNVKYIPAPLRNDVSKQLMNIDTQVDSNYKSESALSSYGTFTIYVGGPAVNSIAFEMNDNLKTMSLPHFERKYGTWVIVSGNREYTDGGVGIVAAIPEEKVWTSSTLKGRWSKDEIRLYRTLIAGIEKEGTVAGGVWYNDQLDLLVTSLNSLKTPVCAGSGNINFNDVVNAGRGLKFSEGQAVSLMSLLQGWSLASMDLIREGDFDGVESAGYVVIVQKQGEGYKVLEVYSIIGGKVEKVVL